ncbi:MAG: SGNH/GDSL hydrolase family protein [Chitinophagaceae bacterium]|nr:SGNH/GDSL hydrolase family protein [Chitinophagaceae bacterium]
MIRRFLDATFFLVFAALLSFGCTKTLQPLIPEEVEEPEPTPTDGLNELNYRGGLPNFFNKIKAGKEVTVAYLGGSITQIGNGWRDMTYNWLDSSFPDATFRQIEASIGGTGSDLGVFRMDEDVLSHNPDLVFVEFATNDHNATAEQIYRSMEGIVRKTWVKYPETDICFVYTMRESNIPALNSRLYQPSAVAMEKIAEHYNIPSIHMGVPVFRLLNADKLVFSGKPAEHPGKMVFTLDGVHPRSVESHKIYAGAVFRGLSIMKNFTAQLPHLQVAAFREDNWEGAQAIPLSEIAVKDGWELLAPTDPVSRPFVRFMPQIYKAATPGASFTIKFNGRVLGFYDLLGPSTSIIDVYIDGRRVTDLVRFDAACTSYRMSSFLYRELPPGDHVVKFVVTGKPIDKLGIFARAGVVITDTSKYSENSWFVSKVFFIGKQLN